MKSLFQEYYRPSEEVFQDLWDNCIFVFDANVLLNMYRYSAGTSKIFEKILNDIKARTWVPYQAAEEFQKNRLKVIYKQEEAYKDLDEYFSKTKSQIENKLNEYKRHPFIDIKKLNKKIESCFKVISSEVEKAKSNHPDLIIDDKIRDGLTIILEDRIGRPYSETQLSDLYKEAEKRFSNETPPGYKDDKTKDGKEKYGDFILWKQILDKAKSEKIPVILVTDDTKDDWWWTFKGKTLGPRPELRKEMLSEANVSFYMYRSDQFMQFVDKFLKYSVDKDAIEEVRRVSKKDQVQNMLNLLMEEQVSEEKHINEIDKDIELTRDEIIGTERDLQFYTSMQKEALSDIEKTKETLNSKSLSESDIILLTETINEKKRMLSSHREAMNSLSVKLSKLKGKIRFLEDKKIEFSQRRNEIDNRLGFFLTDLF